MFSTIVSNYQLRWRGRALILHPAFHTNGENVHWLHPFLIQHKSKGTLLPLCHDNNILTSPILHRSAPPTHTHKRILLKQRDGEWQWHQLGHMQFCTSLQTDKHTSTPPLGFLQARCPSYRPTNSVKALKAHLHPNYEIIIITDDAHRVCAARSK